MLTVINPHDLIEARKYDYVVDALLRILGGGDPITSPKSGYFVGPLNTDMLLQSITVNKYAEVEGIGQWPTGFFVDDSPEAFIEKYHWLLEADPRIFAVFFTWIRKSEEPESGGWRWHKWGEYLGVHEPTTEYLYDEPEIEAVVTVRIVEVRL